LTKFGFSGFLVPSSGLVFLWGVVNFLGFLGYFRGISLILGICWEFRDFDQIWDFLSAAVTDQSPFCQFQARYLHRPDIIVRWMHSYLLDRRQRVKVGNVLSDWLPRRLLVYHKGPTLGP